MNAFMQKYGKRIVWLLAAVFVVSLSYSFYFRARVEVDARAYDRIAWNIVQGNGYREMTDGPLQEDNAILRVGPGYELFLALVYFIFGHHYTAVWIIHALLNTMSAFFVFLLARKIFASDPMRDTIALVAAAMIGLSPDLVTVNGLLLTETLGVFLIVLCAYLFFTYFGSGAGSGLQIFFVGVILAFAIMVRTPAAFLLFPMLFFIYRHGTKEHAAILLCTIAAVFMPWIVRNFNVYHTFVPTNLAYGIDLLSGNHAGATGELEPYAQNGIYLEEFGIVHGSRLLTKEALWFISTNPLEFAKLTIYRLSIYFSLSRPTGFWFHLGVTGKIVTIILSAIYSVLLFVFGFFGLYASQKLSDADRQKVKYLATMLVMMPLAVIGIIVETRYRFLSYPFFAIFAGYGAVIAWRKKMLRSLIAVALILFVNTALDAIRSMDKIIEHIRAL